MNRKKNVAITVPCYKNTLKASEWASLKACIDKLGCYDIFIVAPLNLDLTNVINNSGSTQCLKTERFANENFLSLNAYNKFVLSEEFYSRFSNYDYVLIYQLDAYVFKDELEQWLNKGYDYIGAPWLSKKYITSKGRNLLCRLATLFYCLCGKRRKYRKYKCYGLVGNGGLSLRKVSKMIYITRKYKKQIAVSCAGDKLLYPEDNWLAIGLKKEDSLKVPPLLEALAFSIERDPELAYKWNKETLPFGCHAFDREPYWDFWKRFIKY